MTTPYGGQHFSFMPGNIDTVAQLLATIRRKNGLQTRRTLENMKFYLATLKELRFPARYSLR